MDRENSIAGRVKTISRKPRLARLTFRSFSYAVPRGFVIHTQAPGLFQCRLALVTACLLVASAGPAMAHGKEDHAAKASMDEHMQAMMTVKEQVPEEYRIMERTPIAPDAESLARGAALFLEQCAICHGEKGDGRGPAAATLPTPPANFLDVHHSGMYNPGEKYWIIGNGSKMTGMPPFPDLSPADRWHLVNHILSLQLTPALQDPYDPKKTHHH